MLPPVLTGVHNLWNFSPTMVVTLGTLFASVVTSFTVNTVNLNNLERQVAEEIAERKTADRETSQQGRIQELQLQRLGDNYGVIMNSLGKLEAKFDRLTRPVIREGR